MEWKFMVFSGLLDSDTMYLPELGTNTILKKNFNSPEFIRVGELETDFSKDVVFQRKILRYKDELILIPQYGGKIHFMNIYDGKAESLDCYRESETARISDAVIVGNILLLFPMFLRDGLFSINLDSPQKTLQKEEWFTESCKREFEDDGKTLFARFVKKGNVLYSVKCGSDLLAEIHVAEKRIIIHKIDIDDLFGIWYSKNGFWVSQNTGGCAYLVDNDYNIVKYVNVAQSDKRLFNQVIELNKHVYFAPAYGDSVYSCSLENGLVKAVDLPIECQEVPDDIEIRSFGYSVSDNRDKCVIYLLYACGALWIDDEDNKAEFESFTLRNAEKIRNIKQYCEYFTNSTWDSGNAVVEYEGYSLIDFLDYIRH